MAHNYPRYMTHPTVQVTVRQKVTVWDFSYASTAHHTPQQASNAHLPSVNHAPQKTRPTYAPPIRAHSRQQLPRSIKCASSAGDIFSTRTSVTVCRKQNMCTRLNNGTPHTSKIKDQCERSQHVLVTPRASSDILQLKRKNPSTIVNTTTRSSAALEPGNDSQFPYNVTRTTSLIAYHVPYRSDTSVALLLSSSEAKKKTTVFKKSEHHLLYSIAFAYDRFHIDEAIYRTKSMFSYNDDLIRPTFT